MPHKALGRLRGRGEPRHDILDRILDVNRNYRVSWLPAGLPQTDHTGKGYQRPAMWRVHEHREQPIRQAAGKARVQRFYGMEQVKQDEHIGLLWDAEDWMDGLHLVAEYSESFFGTERMFDDLKRFEKELAESREAVLKAQDDDADRQAEEEFDVNPAYAELVRENAKEWYNRIKGNTSVAVTTPLRSE